MTIVLVLTALMALAVFWLWYDKVMQDGFQWHDLLPTFFTVIVTLAFLVPIHYGVKGNLGSDYMTINGMVLGKAQERTSCEHSYSCNCTTVRTGKTTTRTCQTCYEHPYDYDWVVNGTVGKTYIGRVDRRGTEEPERFSKVIIGEPYSKQVEYFNYIKASPLSVFKDYNAYKDLKTPSYPKVYDYYRIKHVINHNSVYVNGLDDMNYKLSNALKTTSGKSKVNVLVVWYGGSNDIVEATKVKNFGGRINDLTVMIKPDKTGQIENVGVFSWSKNDLVNVKIRDDILSIGKVGPETNQKIVDTINGNVLKYYQKRSNDEFKYLENNIVMPTWVYVLYFFIVGSILGLNIFLRYK